MLLNMNKLNSLSGDAVLNIGGVANSADIDQTAPMEQSDQGLHCLLKKYCPSTLDHQKAWITRNPISVCI